MTASILDNPAEALGGGFADSVHDAQRAFRAIMDAMARPGSLQTAKPVAPPAPLCGLAGTVLLTLCDSDTPVWLDPSLEGSGRVWEWIAFHTDAVRASNIGDAHFCVLTGETLASRMDAMAVGTQAYPDRSATAIVQVPGFCADPDWSLTGPGIRDRVAFKPEGLSDDFLEARARQSALFPCGVDLVFVSGAQLAALPRTTRIVPLEGR